MKKIIISAVFALLISTSYAQTEKFLGKPRVIWVDSVVVEFSQYRTQDSSEEKLNSREIFFKYFSISKDTLYANFPLNYKTCSPGVYLNGERFMAILTDEDANPQKIKYLNRNYLIKGKKVPIIYTKKYMVLNLYL